MTPKSGSACTITAPQAPKAPEEADKADPGEVAKAKADAAEAGKGKYAPEKVPPPPKPQEENLTWVGVELVDDSGKPVPNAAYRAKLPDGSITEGTTDDEGKAKIEGVTPGSVQIQFPDIHGDEWKSA